MQSCPTIATYFSPLQFSNSLHGSQSTGISGSRNPTLQSHSGWRRRKIQHEAIAFFAHPPAVHSPRREKNPEDSPAIWDRMPSKAPCDAALYQCARFLDIESEGPFHFAAPGFFPVLGQPFTGLKSHAIIVHAKERSVRMSDVHGNQWDARTIDLVGDHRSHALVDFEIR